jgi:hypothetical protein
VLRGVFIGWTYGLRTRLIVFRRVGSDLHSNLKRYIALTLESKSRSSTWALYPIAPETARARTIRVPLLSRLEFLDIKGTGVNHNYQ